MIVEQIFSWAQTTPAKTAMRHNGRDISYVALAHSIALTRGYFVREGIGGAGLAVVAVRDALRFWVISLAARSLGLTTILPTIADDIDGRDVRFVVTTPQEKWPNLLRRCEALGLPLMVCTLDGVTALDPGSGPPVALGGHLLYTSGTTGHRKRVLIDPASEEAFHAARRGLLGIDGDTLFHLLYLPAWTGSGYKTPLAVWAAGGGIISDNRLNFHEALRAPDATHAVLVPSMLTALLELPEEAFPQHPNMQLSIIGGAVSAGQVEAMRRRISPNLYNRLSSTETSIFGFTRLQEPDDRRWHRIVPGRVVQIVDERDAPVATGEVGRVRVATAGGPTSYYQDPEASRAFFRDGFFYPGDLGMFRADGRMLLQGRVTDILNINGHKLSPAVVEDEICAKLAIDAVCLFSLQTDEGGEQLYAVIERRASGEADRLAALIRGELGIVAEIRVVNRLARTETGKLQRKNIREQVLGADQAAMG